MSDPAECGSVQLASSGRPWLTIIAPMASVFSGVDWNPIDASCGASSTEEMTLVLVFKVPPKRAASGSSIGYCIATTVGSAETRADFTVGAAAAVT